MVTIEKRIEDESLYRKLFGTNPNIIKEKKAILTRILEIFKRRFSNQNSHTSKKIYLISVPNRVELLGKHTDYQGGETLLLTGPKNIFAICTLSEDGISELINADSQLGDTTLRLNEKSTEVITEGVGFKYSYTVTQRLQRNLLENSLSSLKNVKAVYYGDIPFGGGTSGSSAKLITDFLIFAVANGLLENKTFISLVLENGKKAGIKFNQSDIDNFKLALSMYLAHFENGLDFGDLKGDRGVGTFGGSEDHTAIVLGERNVLLFCRYCSTEVLKKIRYPENYAIVVGYSGIRAEKTKDAMEKYNRLSKDAAEAVKALNRYNKTNHSLLRDFFPEKTVEEKANIAYKQLRKLGGNECLPERAFQFFKEREIISKAVSCIENDNLEGFGKLINESHELSKRYLKNIVPEIDYLKNSANYLGALGATGFGAGFGGSCYAVIPKQGYLEFIKKWEDDYLRKYPQYSKTAHFDLYPACSGFYWESFNS